MKYTIKSLNIWEMGQRANQEDSIFPAYGETNENDRLFILCDGMGGHAAGEVASQTVCSAMSRSVLDNCDAEGRFTDEDFAQALNDAFEALDEKDTGDEKKMGTTMTFLKLHEAGCTIAHMGDSRVYHIRPGKDAEDTEILFETYDHSLVNDLVKVGEITPEEARNYPQKNIITRAMQPNMERRPKADLHHTSNIQPGDYFFMCSDGILEQMEDDNVKFIFSEQGGDEEQKCDMIVKATKENRDNHSAIIIHVLEVVGAPSEQQLQQENVDIPADGDNNVIPETSEDKEMSNLRRFIEKHRHSRKYYMVLNIIVLVSFLSLTCFFIIHHGEKDKRKTEPKELSKKTETKNVVTSDSVNISETTTEDGEMCVNAQQASLSSKTDTLSTAVQTVVSKVESEIPASEEAVPNSDQDIPESDNSAASKSENQ